MPVGECGCVGEADTRGQATLAHEEESHSTAKSPLPSLVEEVTWPKRKDWPGHLPRQPSGIKSQESRRVNCLGLVIMQCACLRYEQLIEHLLRRKEERKKN